MKLKFSILLLISITLFFSSCEDVIEVDVPEAEPRLVIDAAFHRFFDNGQPRSEGVVRLTLSGPFFDNTIQPALGATVRIINVQDERVLEFNDESGDGNYFANFVPEFDRDYRLEIEYEGELYTATERMQPTGDLIDIAFGDKTFLTEDTRELKISFQDVPDMRNYYFFNLDEGNFLVSDDEFYADNIFPFSYFYEDLESGDTLDIQLFGSTPQFNTFLDALLIQSGEMGGSGGPFSVPPAAVKGNIVNRTNPDHFPFGFYRVSEGTSIEVTVP